MHSQGKKISVPDSLHQPIHEVHIVNCDLHDMKNVCMNVFSCVWQKPGTNVPPSISLARKRWCKYALEKFLHV
jgi:hypothetical protein